MQSLKVTESAGRVCLHLGGFARGEGTSLQEAADDLIHRLLALAMAIRAGGCSASRELAQDLGALDFLHELGAISAAGGDIRPRVFD